MEQMFMNMVMSDPELAAGISNPKIMQALSGMMSGQPPSNDPEVQAFLNKVTLLFLIIHAHVDVDVGVLIRFVGMFFFVQNFADED
jgi:hypothetical protein